MAKIRILADETINQIAAGEVIEDPASVVKELVENSIDAKASRVIVELKGGGFQLIRVSDDGIGMEADDALLSLERHATSKITKAEDLLSLASMGFRGEALSSIAAVSKLSLVTATEGKTGLKLTLKEGITAHPRTRGTTVEVLSLFYNVPARKKFQKSPAQAFVDVQKLLVSLSLAHPHIGFSFYHQDSEIFAEAASGLKGRIATLLGRGYTEEVSFSEGPYAVQGFIGRATETRPNRTGQHLFINGRPVFSLPISFAVKESYGTRIEVGRHPIFVLHLKVDPQLVDVNVHPQKREVRFQDEERIRSVIRKAILSAFGHLVLSSSAATFPISESFSSASFRFREMGGADVPTFLEEELIALGLFENYLLLDGRSVLHFGSGLVFVDLLQAQEEIAFRELRSEEGPLFSQQLLLPPTLSLTIAEVAEIENRKSEFEKVGIYLTKIGKESFSIDAVPAFLSVEEASDAVRAMLSSHDLSRTLAHFARSKKKSFMVQEGLAIAKKLLKGAFAANPKTIYHLSLDALQKEFKV